MQSSILKNYYKCNLIHKFECNLNKLLNAIKNTSLN